MTLPKPRNEWLTGPLADLPACPPFPEFTDLERLALSSIAPLFGDGEQAFLAQVASAEVIDRINTIVGFYTRVSVPRSTNKPVRFRKQGAHFEVEGIEFGIGVLLWDVNGDGYLDEIEGYTVGEDPLAGFDLAALKIIRMTLLG